MAVGTEPQPKTSTEPGAQPPATRGDSSGGLRDLLGGLRWTGPRLMAVVIILAALDVVAGWSYLTSYFGYFGIPIEALDLSPGEILAHGVSSMLLTLTVIAAAFLAAAPGNKLGSAVALIGGYVVFLAFVAFVGHLASVVAILAQSAAAIAMAAVEFALRRGFGATAVQRLALAAVGLLLLVSL